MFARLGCCLCLLALLCQQGEAISLRTPVEQDYWPMKNGNLLRTGASKHDAPFNLTEPNWVFYEPYSTSKAAKAGVPSMHVFHSSPMMDSKKNSYFVSTTGWVYSVDVDGEQRWEFNTKAANPGNPVLEKGRLYVSSMDGTVHALDATTGLEIWKRKVGEACPDDTYSLIVAKDTLLVPASVHEPVVHGNQDLVAISTVDGTTLWTFSLIGAMGKVSYNTMPAIYKDSVIFHDSIGGLYRLRLSTGKVMWMKPGVNENSFSTGGSAVGPNGVVYVTSNAKGGIGMLRAYDADTGKKKWDKFFTTEANAAPAIGPIGKKGRLGVVVAIGNNPGPDPNILHQLSRMFGKALPNGLEGKVYALDAQDGSDIWEFVTERAKDTAPAGFSGMDQCWPDHWGNPMIARDGTVYVNWSGGKHFALRDANGDGKVDRNDKLEVSSFKHGYGSNGETASAPGMIVSPSCKTMMAFKA